MNAKIESVDKETFDSVWEIVKEIGEEERHFNEIQAGYRNMASTWLLATAMAIGFIISTNISLNIDAELLIAGIAGVSSLGLSRLWIVDLLIYHRLLDSCFIEGLILEETYPWLPPFRTNMMKTQKGEGVLFRAVGFYLISIVLLILVAGGSLSLWLGSKYWVLSIVCLVLTIVIGILAGYLIYSKTENTDAIRKRLEESRKERAIEGRHMHKFETKRLPVERDDIAPDGSDVRILLGLQGGGLAHFELPPGQISTAVTHKTIEEIWFFLSGRGQMWRKTEGQEEIVAVEAGMCLTIPLGTQFQFRSFGNEPLAAIGVTMPPWPGEDEATVVEGKWKPTLP